MLTLTFARERETKNTVRFMEVVNDGERGIVGTLYVAKPQDEEFGHPGLLTVTIQPDGEKGTKADRS
jgi:hypothetical protein